MFLSEWFPAVRESPLHLRMSWMWSPGTRATTAMFSVAGRTVVAPVD